MFTCPNQRLSPKFKCASAIEKNMETSFYILFLLYFSCWYSWKKVTLKTHTTEMLLYYKFFYTFNHFLRGLFLGKSWFLVYLATFFVGYWHGCYLETHSKPNSSIFRLIGRFHIRREYQSLGNIASTAFVMRFERWYRPFQSSDWCNLW